MNYTPAAATRYQIHELLRQFGAEQLDALPAARTAVEVRHSVYYLAFLAAHELRLAQHEPRQAAAEIQEELDNIRRAWAHAAATANITQLGKSATALTRYYDLTGLIDECRQELRRAVAALEATPPASPAERSEHQSLLSKLLALLASIVIKQGKFDEGMTLAQRAIDLGRAHGGFEGEVYGWLILGQGLYRKGDYHVARTHFLQGLRLIDAYQSHKVTLSLLSDAEYMVHGWLGATESEMSNFAAAQRAFDQCIARCRQINNPRAEV
ncbi:MAG: hypothetical protein R2867_37330 [Caldilineaceae bacterium]